MDNNLSFWLFVFVQPIVFAAFIFAALYMLSGWGILRSRFAHDQKPVGTEYRFIRFSVGFLFPVRFFGGLAVMHAQGIYLKPAISLVFKPISIPWHQIASIEQPGYLFGGVRVRLHNVKFTLRFWGALGEHLSRTAAAR